MNIKGNCMHLKPNLSMLCALSQNHQQHTVAAPESRFFLGGGGIEGAKIQILAENGRFWPFFLLTGGGGGSGGRASD